MSTSRGAFAVLDCAPPQGIFHRGTVLLLPGFNGSKEDFLPLLAPLASAGFRAVAVDGKGQFESGGPREEEAYTQEKLAADVVAQTAVLTAPAGSPPVHLLGHSLGGLIARAAVLHAAPSSCPWASLSLLASGPASICHEQQVRIRLLLEALPVLGIEATWLRLWKAAGYDELPASSVEFLRRRWLSTVPQQLTTTGRQLLTEPDRVNELTTSGLPVHVLSGTHDYAWPVPWQDEMAARLGARRSVIAGGRHSPQVERPVETAMALVAFWCSIG